jgi:ankyrin repeat protein
LLTADPTWASRLTGPLQTQAITYVAHARFGLFDNTYPTRQEQIVRLLLSHGTDDFWLLERIRELTPVQIAERAGATETVAYLLAKGAVDNRTPRDLLIGACVRADEEATRRILREYPRVVQTLTVRDHSNFATVARQGLLTSVQFMLDVGFDIDARADDLEATGLHYAATRGDAPMAKLLLSRGARFDLKHKYGGTPAVTAIYCAANFRNPHGQYAAVVKLLLDAGEKIPNDRLEFAVANDLHPWYGRHSEILAGCLGRRDCQGQPENAGSIFSGGHGH